MDREGSLPVEMVGHRATTLVKINGHDTRVMLDSGAFFNIMSKASAEQLGLRIGVAPAEITPDSTGSLIAKSAYVSGVGGKADIGSTAVRNFGMLDATFHNVMFLVGGSDIGMPILGANLLDAFDLDIDLAQGKLNLVKTSGCGNTALAYWVKDGPYQMVDLNRETSDNESYVTVLVNGHPVRALIDIGSPETLLARHAAERAGIDLKSSQAKPGEPASGIGTKSYQTWIVPIDKFQVGSETIQHSQMLVLDGDITPGDDSADMLLGLDFVLAHHMYIANDQGKIYFTYNGGRVFALAQPPASKPVAADATIVPAETLKTAADFALRGQAHLARGEDRAAVADFDVASKLEPGKASYYLMRAQANEQSSQDDAGLADVNQVLALEPQNVDALLLRARLLMQRQDYAAAKADVVSARKLEPEGSGGALSIAEFDMTTDQPGEALPIYDAWIRLHPDDAGLGEILNARCWARGLTRQMLDGALVDCRRAIKLDGPKAGHLDSLGLVLLRQGDFVGATAVYNRALATLPSLAWSHFGRGLIEKHNGQINASTADLTSARAILPQIDTRAAQYGLAIP